MIRSAALALALTGGAAAQEVPQDEAGAADGDAPGVVVDIDQSDVSITSTFAGSDILVFGAIRGGAGDEAVIVTVEGPSGPVEMRRLGRIGPIWANTAAITVDRAPSYYAVATSAPVREILSATADLRERVTVPRAIRAVGEGDPAAFVEALIRLRTAEGAYLTRPGGVRVKEDALFRASIPLPSDLTEGLYRVRTLLTRERVVVARSEALLPVQKVGLERMLYKMAHERPALYGLMSIAIAVAAGWGASAAFSIFRR